MGSINYVDGNHLHCTNGKVRAIWETGSIPYEGDPTMKYNLHLILYTDERKDFQGDTQEVVWESAELFLQTL